MAINLNFTTLVQTIMAADLGSFLNGTGPLTLFAPTDAAFDKLPAGVVAELVKLGSRTTLSKILEYHLFLGNMTLASINATNITTNLIMFTGGIVRVTRIGNTLRVNNANVIRADLFAANGLIHAIDTVLLPAFDIIDTVIANADFKILIVAMRVAGLVNLLRSSGPFTIFAPSDAAFNKLPQGVVAELQKPENAELIMRILRYHILTRNISYIAINATSITVEQTTLEGSRVTLTKNVSTFRVNNANVLTADIFVSNGVIHAIDSVLLPSFDIVETAITNSNFTTFITALRAANLLAALKSTTPLTVFAPMDVAFSKLPTGVVTDLLKIENREALRRILQYHVLSGNVTSASINAKILPTNITMLTGDRVTLTMSGGIIRVNNASVLRADIFAANGVIHAIDTVLFPSLDIVDTAITSGNFKTLISALRATDVVNTLRGLGPFTVFAPSDVAFNKLPSTVLNDLLKPQNTQNLSNLLMYHVLNRRLTTADINNITLPANITTLAGGSVRLTRFGTTLQVNDANVVVTDIPSTNGFIHIIDSVLMPSQTKASASLIYLHYKLFDGIVFVTLFPLLSQFRMYAMY